MALSRSAISRTGTTSMTKTAATAPLYRVQFAGVGLWSVRNRVVADFDVRADDPEAALRVAQRAMLNVAPSAPIANVDITRVTIRKLR